MLEYLSSVSWPPVARFFNNDQMENRKTWAKVPDGDVAVAAVHTITMVPTNASTVTYVNPLDPGSGEWMAHPDSPWGRVLPAGRV